MKKVALCLLMSVSLLGCGSDDSRPGIAPGLGATPPQPNKPTNNPSQTPNKPNEPPTDSTAPPPNPNDNNNSAKSSNFDSTTLPPNPNDTSRLRSTSLIQSPSNMNETTDLPNTELLSGIYTGSSTWVTGKTYVVNGLVDDNKRFWFINSNSNNSGILSFTNSNENVKGSNGRFSVPGKEYSYEDRKAIDITIEGNYKTPKIVQGKTFDLPSNPTTYTVKYDEKLSGTEQNFDWIDNKTFTGHSYTIGDTKKSGTTIIFSNEGNFTGNAEGCIMTGNLTPAGSGRYFNAIVNFTSSACFANGETHSGVALLDGDNELVFLGTDSSKHKGTMFSGEMR